MKKQTLIALVFACLVSVVMVACNTDAQPCFNVVPDSPTAGSTIEFDNCTINGNTFEWDFGDGNVSTARNPTHVYDTAGTYKVTLSAQPKNGNSPSLIAKNVIVN